MDNGTMVETFKYMNYCQLAKNSLVSNRFRNLIQTHRYSLPLLYIDAIVMNRSVALAGIKVFDKELTSETYNDWIISNSYSKHVPLEEQVSTMQSTQNVSYVYALYAFAHYKDLSNLERNDKTNVFTASVKLNHDNWPAFQHFVRLATDPFIYIDSITLTYQHDVLNMLARAISSDRSHLQCNKLDFDLESNSPKSIIWAKDHVRCNQFYFDPNGLNHEEAFLHFFVTGAHCTPLIKIGYCDLSKVVVEFVQKFTALKNSDEIQFVEGIEGNFKTKVVELLQRNYANLIVKEERHHRRTQQVFDFVNNDIAKKLQLTVIIFIHYRMSDFSIKISNV